MSGGSIRHYRSSLAYGGVAFIISTRQVVHQSFEMSFSYQRQCTSGLDGGNGPPMRKHRRNKPVYVRRKRSIISCVPASCDVESSLFPAPAHCRGLNVSEAVSRSGKVLARAKFSTLALTRASFFPQRTRLLIARASTPRSGSTRIVAEHVIISHSLHGKSVEGTYWRLSIYQKSSQLRGRARDRVKFEMAVAIGRDSAS